MKNKTSHGSCHQVHSAVQDTLYVVNGKWKLVILSILVLQGTKRFGELSRESGISPRILSKELHEMEMNKLVSRKVCDTRPVTVEYSSTPYAQTLTEVIESMIRWGQNHRKKIMEHSHAGINS
jgi:DNA-binding HxlR family transcriptional regulator